MKLNELRDNKGARKSRVRVGRGIGSGHGKTAGRGQKGAEEPLGRLDRRLRGRPDAAPHAAAEARLQQHLRQGLCRGEPRRDPEAIDAGKLDAKGTLDHDALKAAGLARGGKDGVRLLGKGELKAKLSFKVAGVSKGAREAVEKAGGSVELIERKDPRRAGRGQEGQGPRSPPGRQGAKSCRARPDA